MIPKRMVSENGVGGGCCLITVFIFHRGPIWSLISVVSHQSRLFSRWSFIGVVSHQLYPTTTSALTHSVGVQLHPTAACALTHSVGVQLY